MTQTPLKLVRTETSGPSAPTPPDLGSTAEDPFRLNRRRAERHHVAGRVTAVTTPQGPTDNRGRICSLQLRDISDLGMGALSQEAIELDSPITVFFPAHGPERGFDAWGRVVRCMARDFGHELGIRFEARPAA